MVPLSIMVAKPIGVRKMLDQNEADDKIIAVHAHDPEYAHYNTIEDLPPRRLSEIRRFFEDYKALEGKTVVVERFLGRFSAFELVNESALNYRTLGSLS